MSQFERWNGVSNLLRIRMARKRRPEAEGLNIASAYSRDFTGTAAFNRKEVEAAITGARLRRRFK